MYSIDPTELSGLDHVNVSALQGRTLLMLPLWDRSNWHIWVSDGNAGLLKLQVIDAAHSLYLSKFGPADESDISLNFLNFVWQRLSFADILPFIEAIEDDFHLLSVISSKMEFFYENRGSIDNTLISSFIRSEIEHIIIICRSIFDLLQEVVSRFWNSHVSLVNEQLEVRKKRHRLPAAFRKLVLLDDKFVEAEAITEKYALPEDVARAYVKHAVFFERLRTFRDQVVHGNKSAGSVFVTEKGFCIYPHIEPYREFEWKSAYYYNSNIVSLKPWISYIVCRSLSACVEVLEAFNSVIRMPEEMWPGHRVFLRDPANPALSRLLRANEPALCWWGSDAEG